VILIMLLLSQTAFSAPAPATSSSAVIDSDRGLYRSALGFSINKGTSNWAQSLTPSQTPSIVALYKAPKLNSGIQPALSVRTDILPQARPLKVLAREWMKDYHRLGFDVLGSKPVTVAGQNAFLIDVVHRETRKQLRQVMFVRDRTQVVLTCRDHTLTFQQTLHSCNDIIKTFRWTPTHF
jgi:hypothetical protein